MSNLKLYSSMAMGYLAIVLGRCSNHQYSCKNFILDSFSIQIGSQVAPEYPKSSFGINFGETIKQIPVQGSVTSVVCWRGLVRLYRVHGREIPMHNLPNSVKFLYILSRK